MYKDAAAQAEKIGLPIMIKAAAGGGGKGIRIVREASQLANEMNMAQSESRAAFGNGDVYFEKYIELPRHIEVQFARDSFGNLIAFPERDCSIQRRHQKLVEESPSPAVNKKLREALEDAAVKLAEAATYVGVGTVEFLLTQTGEFYFMEVNTRLQVEHPVTEFITGFDLVREQLLAASGEKLSYTGGHTVRRGLPCRVTAQLGDNVETIEGTSSGECRYKVRPCGPTNRAAAAVGRRDRRARRWGERPPGLPAHSRRKAGLAAAHGRYLVV